MTLPRLLAAALAAAALLPASPAAAAPRTCKSADLRYPFEPGGPKTFGVFRLKIDHGTCTTAHRVAKKWMKGFEADLRQGHVRLRRRVEGFAFATLPPNAAQTYRLKGTKGATILRFDYVVPNG